MNFKETRGNGCAKRGFKKGGAVKKKGYSTGGKSSANEGFKRLFKGGKK